jgi:hypothetical protein
MWNLAFAFLIALAVVGVVAWHRERWLAKRRLPSPVPMVSAVSPITGAIIATGTEALSDASHQDGDGCGHFGDACHHDGMDA